MTSWGVVASGSSKRARKIYSMDILKITHNAGFFSCCSKRLEGVVWFFDAYHRLPDIVDSSEQFSLYKSNSTEDLTSLYFKNPSDRIEYIRSIRFYNDAQFLDYADLDFIGLHPFIKKYFSPSDHVLSILSSYEHTYRFDYRRTCAVFYRGNDKVTETSIATYDRFIAQAQQIKDQYPDTVFLVQTDETEFLDAFRLVFSDVVVIGEVPHMHKKNSTIHDELPREDRAAFGANFFAALLVVSKCEYLITHSGNCGLWAVLYRGNNTHVYQWLNNSWQRSKAQRIILSLKKRYKQILKRILKKEPGYLVVTSEESSASDGSRNI